MKIGLIGMGRVGTSVAVSILEQGVARELIVHDRDRERAAGEVLDLQHGNPFYPAATVRLGELDDVRKCDAIVISAGRNSRPEETRLDLLRDNAKTMVGLARTLTGFRGLVLVVSNPVDILTQIVTEASGLPPARVLGTGTLLDTARLRHAVGRDLGVDPRSVHGHVLGEHGDSEVIPWSAARIGGAPLRTLPGWSGEREAHVATEVREAAYEIIRRKGATNHAIGMATAALLRWALRDEKRVLTVSRVQVGAAGIAGIALSLPAVVGIDGASTIVEPEMDAAERRLLERSADVLREARRTIDG